MTFMSPCGTGVPSYLHSSVYWKPVEAGSREAEPEAQRSSIPVTNLGADSGHHGLKMVKYRGLPARGVSYCDQTAIRAIPYRFAFVVVLNFSLKFRPYAMRFSN